MKQLYLILLLLSSVFLKAQQTEYVDFLEADLQLKVLPENKEVSGTVHYYFDILKSIDSIYLDAVNMNVSSVILNGKNVTFKYNGKKIWIVKPFKPSKKNHLSIVYNVFPNKTMYFVGWDNSAPNQVWTQGQGKYTSNWLPSIDDVNEKIEFDLSIEIEDDYQVISNGKLIEKENYSGFNTWHYDMEKPMSSYLAAIAIGKYNKKLEYSNSGIPLEMYYYPADSLKVEPTYRYTKQIFDFLEEEIGVPFPWQNYKQVPVHDFLYAGMENTGCTIFSDAFMVDDIGFVDKNYLNINAHELAHQWFGNLVTAKTGEHHWLQEGFATYYALLAEREVFGDDYYYWRLYEYAQELIEQHKSGRSTSLLNPKSSSITFYKKGAWVLHALREKVGDRVFKKAVRGYLINNKYNSAITDDFLAEIKRLSNVDLSSFEDEWLLENSFSMEQVIPYLTNSDIGKQILRINNLTDNKDIYAECIEVVESDKHYSLLHSLFNKLEGFDVIAKNELFLKALQSKDVMKRQAVAFNLKEIPYSLKKEYESLLDDKSYFTIEAALFNLWNSFPEDQEIYLEKTRHLEGFADKNIKLLWLTLAILTDNDDIGKSDELLNELISYTSDDYSFEVRQKAFNYLRWIRSCNEECIENIKQATNHHNWRFKQFAKNYLESY